MRRWVRLRRVRYCILCVWSPVCHHANKEVGFRWQTTATCAWWSFTCSPCTAWAGISPPQFGLLCWPVSADCIYIHIYITFGLCVLKCPTGAKCPRCSPVSKVPDIWCIYSWQQFAQDWIDTSCLRCIDLEKDAQRFQLNPPSRLCVCRVARPCKQKNKETLFIIFFFSQAELTFCAGDVITVFGEIDEDGFYYVSTTNLKFWKLKAFKTFKVARMK